MKDPGSILITGASSGIGEALAMHYAGPGVNLALSGRNAERLEAVAAACRAAGATVRPRVIDVADRGAMDAWIRGVDEEAPLELVIANAGVGLGKSDLPSLADIAEQTFAINVHGVFHTAHPAIDVMRPRGRGQIAIMSSVAGFVGMPGAVPYGASKAAVRSYGEGLRGAYGRHGLEVSVICPGFVVSRMTRRNKFKMPFIMDTGRAARIIAKGLERNKGRIAFPWQTYGLIRLLDILPVFITERILRRSPDK